MISIHPQLEGTFIQQKMRHKILIGSLFQANEPTQGVFLRKLAWNPKAWRFGSDVFLCKKVDF